MRDWGAVGRGRGLVRKYVIVECWGRCLVRDYVILDSSYRHIYDYPAERVENYVIARAGRNGRVGNHVIAECAALQEYKIT